MQGSTRSTSIVKTFSLVFFIAIVGFVVGAWFTNKQDKVGNSIPGVLPNPQALTAFSLTKHNHSPFTLESLHGKWTFLFFGYTHCPDVCPTTLSELANAQKQLKHEPGALENTQFIFVSVDPDRDTLELLKGYTAYFNKDFIGATGSAEQIKILAKQLGVRYSRGDQSDAGYVVNHSSAIMLIDPLSRFYARLKAPHYAEEVQTQFLNIRKSFEQSTSQP